MLGTNFLYRPFGEEELKSICRAKRKKGLNKVTHGKVHRKSDEEVERV